MNREISAKLVIKLDDIEKLYAIHHATFPDNFITVQKNLQISQEMVNNSVNVTISSNDIGILKYTVDDLLKCIIVANKVLDQAQKVLK